MTAAGTGPTIRVARPDEYERAGEIVVAAYEAENYLRHPGDGSYDHAYAAKLADVAGRAVDSEVMVGELDGELVGTFTWCGSGSSMRELALDDDQGEFRMLGVLPQAAGRGVASAMVRWCLRRAHDEGLSEIVMSSLPEMVPAHRLYSRLGFVRRPELDWSPVPGVQLIAFGIRLTPAAASPGLLPQER